MSSPWSNSTSSGRNLPNPLHSREATTTSAAATKVRVEMTVAKIETTVMKTGVDTFGSFSTRNAARIAFQLGVRRILFKLPTDRGCRYKQLAAAEEKDTLEPRNNH